MRTQRIAAATEAAHQAQVLELATRLGWRSMHVRKAMGKKKSKGGTQWLTPTSLPGWPDAVLWHPKQKRVLFVEFKTDTGRVSPAQRDVLGSLMEAGCEVYVWRPRDFDTARAVLSGEEAP